MLRSLCAGALAVGLMACSSGAAKDAPPGAAGTSERSAPKSTAGSSLASSGNSLASGTRVAATIQTALSSRTTKAGATAEALVSLNVTDASGRVVIPAGSTVRLKVLQIEPGSDQVRPEGRLSLEVSSVTVNGQTYDVNAALDPVAHHLEGRGITKDEAARIAAGTAIGAAAGQVIGKNTKSTVIGGAVGAVAGGAVAVRYAYRDVVVSAGTPISFTLTQTFALSAR